MHSFLGAKHRKQLIDVCQKLLPLTDENSSERIVVLNHLANAYEGEYLFDSAIEVYKSFPFEYCPAHICIARLLVKKNQIDEAIEYLESTQRRIAQCPYFEKRINLETLEFEQYPIYQDDIKFIGIHINELKEKKERGYVYKPRKKRMQ